MHTVVVPQEVIQTALFFFLRQQYQQIPEIKVETWLDSPVKVGRKE